jgi:hypothetical protein
MDLFIFGALAIVIGGILLLVVGKYGDRSGVPGKDAPGSTKVPQPESAGGSSDELRRQSQFLLQRAGKSKTGCLAWFCGLAALGWATVGVIFLDRYPAPRAILLLLASGVLSFVFGYAAFKIGRPWYTDFREGCRLLDRANTLAAAPPEPDSTIDSDARREEQRAQRYAEVRESRKFRPFDEVPLAERPFHVWIPGAPGKGKSTLMLWMARSDIWKGIECQRGPRTQSVRGHKTWRDRD